MKKDDLLRAAAVARSLDPAEKSATDLITQKVADEFFGEHGIPQHLKDGWAALEENRRVRAEIGIPLPPGGCVLTGFEAVIAGAVAECHTAIARALRLESKYLRLSVNRTAAGLGLNAVVDPPQSWVLPSAQTSSNYDEAVKVYVARVTKGASLEFRRLVAERLGCFTRRRSDVDPEISVVRE